jgi:hypothetical protein
MTPDKDIPELIHRLANSGSHRKRMNALERLCEIGLPALPAVLDSATELREGPDAVIATMGFTIEKPAVDMVLSRLMAGETRLVNALSTMANAGTDGAFEALTEVALAHRDEAARMAARVGIHSMFGFDVFGPDFDFLHRALCQKPTPLRELQQVMNVAGVFIVGTYATAFGLAYQEVHCIMRRMALAEAGVPDDQADAETARALDDIRRETAKVLGIAEGYHDGLVQFCRTRGFEEEAVCELFEHLISEERDVARSLFLPPDATGAGPGRRLVGAPQTVPSNQQAKYLMERLLRGRFPRGKRQAS